MIDRATQYAEQVAIGNIVACKEHRQACERHLRDMERQGTKDFPYSPVRGNADYYRGRQS